MYKSIALALAAVAVPTAHGAPAQDPAAPRPATGVAGSWTGQFAQTDWTFELTNEGSGWKGRYMSSRGKGWHPLQSVVVSGGSATFSIPSQPQLTFALKLNPAGDALSGDLRIEGHLTLPFSATRTRTPA